MKKRTLLLYYMNVPGLYFLAYLWCFLRGRVDYVICYLHVGRKLYNCFNRITSFSTDFYNLFVYFAVAKLSLERGRDRVELTQTFYLVTFCMCMFRGRKLGRRCLISVVFGLRFFCFQLKSGCWFSNFFFSFHCLS